MLMCFLASHMGLWVRPCTRYSLRPLLFGRDYRCKNSGLTGGENAMPCPPRRGTKAAIGCATLVERLIVVGGARRRQPDVARAESLFGGRLLTSQCGFPGADQREAEIIVHRKNRPLCH